VIVCVAGLIVSAYGCLQVVGRDPFLSASSYTFKSPEGNVTRIPSTLGHSNYLGNFLLYTIPLTSSLALAFHSRARRIAIASIAISIAALVFSGTRGAWVGLAVGAIVFVMLALKARAGEDANARDRLTAASDGKGLRFKGAKFKGAKAIGVVAVLIAAVV